MPCFLATILMIWLTRTYITSHHPIYNSRFDTYP